MRISRHLQLMIFCLVLLSAAACADEVEYVVSGVDEPMLSNVRHHVAAFRIGSNSRLNGRLRRKMIEDAKKSTVRAMRPYGFFHPQVAVDMRQTDADKWVLSVDVSTGPPILIKELELELTGPGSGLKSLREWHTGFPLAVGRVLDQQAWDTAKAGAIELLEKAGYLQAEFIRHQIRVDPVANAAWLSLVLDTGPQAVMGNVTFNQNILSNGVLASLRRFRQGDVYNVWLLEKFRLDLWRSGYFEGIEVVERKVLSADSPRVDLEVNLTPRKRNTYQGTIGFGTDTLARAQFLWRRHLLSPRGDNFDVGFGWLQKDNNYSAQANYRLPRETDTHQFWIASAGINSEQQQLEVSTGAGLEDRFDLARGTVNDYSLKLGKTRARNMRGGFQQLFETPFIQLLNENHDFQLINPWDETLADLSGTDSFNSLLHNTSNTLVAGLEWDWPEIRGSGFHAIGHHERAWIFTSNSVWGSDFNFSQVYLSSRWNLLAGERWKFLFRAEAGYSDSSTISVKLPINGTELDVAATHLPHLYRFKAGGSRSVRGYAYGNLDNNGLGSNNILTASAEIEFHFRKDWSIATFFDIGNAFNDWSKPDLKRGAGLGLRWYSVIGAVRLDVAQAWDLQGEPWRIHLTIGTPLL